MDDSIKRKAIEYWQNELAKFWPTAKGPSVVEIDMFEAGYNAGFKDNIDVLKYNLKLETELLKDKLNSAEAENKRLREELLAEQEELLAEHQAAVDMFSKYDTEREKNILLREALELIATPKRPDGTYNRSREACEQLAKEALVDK